MTPAILHGTVSPEGRLGLEDCSSTPAASGGGAAGDTEVEPHGAGAGGAGARPGHSKPDTPNLSYTFNFAHREYSWRREAMGWARWGACVASCCTRCDMKPATSPTSCAPL